MGEFSHLVGYQRWLLLVGLGAIVLSCKSLPEAEVKLTSTSAEGKSYPRYDFEDDGAVLNLDYQAFDEKNLSSEAANGLKYIMEGKGFNYGIPIEVVKLGFSRLKVKEEELPQFLWRNLGEIPAPPTYRPYGFMTSLANGVFEQEGKVFSNGNCFACHAGVINGYVIPGLPNTNHDEVGLSNIAKTLKDSWRSWLGKGMKYTQLNKKQRRSVDGFLWHFNEILEPTFKFGKHRGANMGAYSVWKLLVKLKDPGTSGFDLVEEGSDTAIDKAMFPADLVLPPIEPNPWWVRKFRSKSYWYQDAYTTDQRRRAARHFAVNFTVPQSNMNQNFVKHVDEIETILGYIDETQAPELPRDMKIDDEKVALGRALFHGEKVLEHPGGRKLVCTNCHGTYRVAPLGGWEVDFTRNGAPIPLVNANTDPEYSKLLIRFKPIVDHIAGLKDFLKKNYDSDDYPEAKVPSEDDEGAYAPPPLVGLWASAPYFHNGSVPTLWSVLKSSSRPKIWKKSINPKSYDFEKVGLDVKELTESEYADEAMKAKDKSFEQPDSISFRRIYNTQHFGMSAAGHTFGDAMSDAERSAVIEFLKSVTGKNIRSVHPQAAAGR